MLERANFWYRGSKGEHVLPDGSGWIIEGRAGRAYNVVLLWSPRDQAYRDLGLLFMRVAGLSTDESSVH